MAKKKGVAGTGKKQQRSKKGAERTTKEAKPVQPSRGAPASFDYSSLERMAPTKALAAIVGDEKLFHSEASRRVWSYVKLHGLQDRQNPLLVNADDKLKPIFGGRSQVSTDELTKAVMAELKKG